IKSRIAALQADAIRHHAAGKKGAAQKLSAEQDIKRLRKQLDGLLNPAAMAAQGELNQQSSWRNLLRIQELHDRFFGEDSREEKNKLRRELDALEWNFMEAKLRGFLARELPLQQLIDFGDAPVFEAIAYASILTATRNAPPQDAAALGYTWEREMSFERIAQIVPERGQKIRQDELKPDGWQLESPQVVRLLEKLRNAGKPLGEYVNGRFYNGVKTGLNEAFVVDRA